MACQQPQPQANMLPAAPSSASSERLSKPRHRASVACSSCRDRRTRCVILTGESRCTQCKSNNQECIVKYDDERRKPNSKAYISSLTDRITHLENLLRESDQRDQQSSLPSTANQQIDDNHLGDSDQLRHRATQEVAPDPNPHAPAQHDLFPPDTDLDAVSPQSSSSLGSASMVSKLLSTTGHLSFDQLSGRLRYFGPLANCHVHSELKSESEYAARQALEQQRRAEKAIRSISLDTHDYLMQLFWDCYNSVLHVIHQATFEEDRERGEGRFYSGFLHLCILAMGYRFADKTRADIVRISLPDKENTLQREAKFMLEYEIEQPGGIPSIVALLILGDLETGVGRDNLGWLYAGMANRLCFEIGLHLDTTNTGASAREIEIGRMTLWACIIYDKYWALFLGRPTMMKPADLEVYKLSQQFERLGTSLPAGPDKSRETLIYEALLDLMELAGKITEIMDQASKLNTNIDHHVYFRMSEIHRELEMWYSRLPPSLQWNAGNIATSPFSFFLLHQQYSGAMILLHRPFARYDDPTAVQPGSGDTSEDDSDTGKVSNPTNHFSALSRTICTQHAVRIARIFWQHRQRFDTRQIFVTGLQHAGTAATALVAALAFMKDRSTRNNNMQYLECIAAALQDMSHTYVPAEKMSNVLEAVILELRDAVPEKRTVPARRSSSHHDSQDRISTKRHQSFHHDPPPGMPEDDMARRQQQSNTLFSTNSNDSQFSNSTATNGHGPATQRHDPIQATQPDDWTFVGLHRTSSHPNDWPPLSHDLSSFDQPKSAHERSSSSSSNMHPSHLTQHTSTNFVPTTSTANFNFTQYRSSNAWMGAETPRTGLSPPPVGMQTPPFLPNQQSQRHQTSQRAALHEIQDFTSTDFVSLLNPDDRLDFGNLGMPTGMNMGMGMGMSTDMNVNTTGLNSSAMTRDLDGYPPLPTPKFSAPGDGVGNISSGDDADGRGDAEARSGLRQRRDGVNDPTRLKTMETMAGLADMMRRRG